MVKMTLGQKKTDKKLRGYLRNFYWKVLVIQQQKLRYGTPVFGHVMNPDLDPNALMSKIA